MKVRTSPDDSRLVQAVQRSAPTRAPRREQVRLVPLDEISPVIRIAHRLRAPLEVRERIIVDHELVLFLAGSGELRLRDRTLGFAAHDLFFLEPFVPHALSSRGVCEHLAIHFDFTPRAAPLESRRPYAVRLAGPQGLVVRQKLAARGAVERALCELVDQFGKGTPYGRLRARGELTCALSALLDTKAQARGEAGRRRALLEKTTAAMRARLAEPLTSADLERAAGLGKSQLHALFRELTGHAPMDFLRRMRVDAAKALLADPELSIKQVALAAGFGDPYHFSRVFSRIDGVPPSAYREALLAGKSSIPS